MPNYQPCGQEEADVLELMVERYHQPLRDAGVTFNLLFAFASTDENGDPAGNALTHGGYPAAAVVRIVNLKDRVKGCADVEITIDQYQWEEMSPPEREALIDHELTHLELKTNEAGIPERDDWGRPKLKIRKHDRQFGWFDECVERHGEHAAEARQMRQFMQQAGDLYLKR